MRASRADLSQAFCSYCGYPPMGRWRSLAHRVCMRCQIGTVRRAPPGLQPRFDEPFVIVDPSFCLQAVSHHARVVLMVDEPAAVNLPLGDFLVCHPNRHQTGLAALIQRAVRQPGFGTTVELRTVSDPAIDVVARITGCSPPLAALLILTSLTTTCRQRPQRVRRPERVRRHAAVADGSITG